MRKPFIDLFRKKKKRVYSRKVLKTDLCDNVKNVYIVYISVQITEMCPQRLRATETLIKIINGRTNKREIQQKNWLKAINLDRMQSKLLKLNETFRRPRRKYSHSFSGR